MKRALVFSIVFVVLAGFALVGAFWHWLDAPVRTPDTPVEIRIKPGMGPGGIVEVLAQHGVFLRDDLFVLASRLLSLDARLKAGVYAIPPHSTPRQLLTIFSSGKSLQTSVRLIEGQTFAQWRAQLAARDDLGHDLLGVPDQALVKRLGIEVTSPEGLFFPDTYLVEKYADESEVLRLARRQLRQHLDRLWRNRDSALPYRTPYEALIMASIIEKETGRNADRAMIAAVFVNRLRLGMRLQTDPTVIYGLGDAYTGNLQKRHLTTDTPWNTYTRPGLPPTPIAMPGLASLEAAFHPAKTKALYFVGTGDGGSQFSESLAEHNRAVQRYQRGGRAGR
ncbi:MAG: endolytic transglycosylase MltG [Zoogloeaceae bacterium]|jgi:UPF0755 protein|nr:endolytic transglycosylase MltG [Zoogloeaceae bacterium]